MPLDPCPLLGTLDDEQTPGPPVEYPSFENRCLVADERDTLLLADQATYCLSGGCRLCPRYRAADAMATHGRVDTRTAADLTGGALASDQLRPELMGVDEGGRSRRWSWLGAGVLLITLMLCGATLAAWTGWQQVQAFLDARAAGQVQAVAAQPAAPAYIIVTAPAPATLPPATPATNPAAPNPAAPNPAAPNPITVDPAQVSPPGAPAAFPQAVTPTPLPAGGAATPTPPPLIVVDPAALLPTEAPPNILLEVPTRRATPVFDIPTSTAAAEIPTSTLPPTFTPTPLGTPVVLFQPAQQLLPNGGCTIVSWNVQNVREVYYENVGVDGRGQREECVDDLLTTYHLVVILEDGSARTYTTTVTMLMPTATPEPTSTFTREPLFTPTWTPLPPTATPTPNVRWGVAVNVSGSTQQECAAGASCEVGLVVTNTGDQVDTLLVGIVEGEGWGAQLCRGDGVCATSNLVLPTMGPGNAATLVLRVSLPGDAAGATARYGVQAVSSGSGGSVSSGSTAVTIVAR